MIDEDADERAALVEYLANEPKEQAERLAAMFVARERAQELERLRAWKRSDARRATLWV